MRKKTTLLKLVKLAAGTASATFASAAPIEHATPDPGLDPTVLRSRVKVTNEFIDRAFEAPKDTTKLNLSHAFGTAARRDWTVQLGLPLIAYRAGDQGGAPDATGISGRYEMPLIASASDHTATVGCAYMLP